MRCGGDGRTGLYGWRKRCLYAVLLLMSVVALGNLAATLLLMNNIHFHFGGIGDMAIISGGVQLRDGGVSHVHDSLATPKIASQPGRPVVFAGRTNVSLAVADSSGAPTQSLEFLSTPFEINKRVASVTASRFSVSDPRGRTLFAAAPGRVTVGTDQLIVLGGGVQFSGSVQTSMVRSSTDLMLESATRRLLVTSPGEVSVESRTSGITVSCLTDLQLTSIAGRIKFKASGVVMPDLELVKHNPMHAYKDSKSYVNQDSPPKSYQICVCFNGKLFVSRPDGSCSVDHDLLQCR